MNLKEKSILRDICLAPKENNLIVTSKLTAGGCLTEHKVSPLICAVPVLSIGKMELPIPNQRLAGWLLGIITAMTFFNGKLREVVKIEDQSLVDSHFPQQHCFDCLHFNLVIRGLHEIGRGEVVSVSEVLSTDTLSGRGKIVSRAELSAKYGTGNRSPLNN
jgi:hypothetical protein